jgi:hypothetical protein
MRLFLRAMRKRNGHRKRGVWKWKGVGTVNRNVIDFDLGIGELRCTHYTYRISINENTKTKNSILIT